MHASFTTRAPKLIKNKWLKMKISLGMTDVLQKLHLKYAAKLPPSPYSN
jgi:hypothetical protein